MFRRWIAEVDVDETRSLQCLWMGKNISIIVAVVEYGVQDIGM
jgi:hypothetical protein